MVTYDEKEKMDEIFLKRDQSVCVFERKFKLALEARRASI